MIRWRHRQRNDLVVGESAPLTDHRVLAELVDRLGIPPDPQDHQLAVAFGNQALVEQESAEQVEALEQFRMMAEHTEDVQRRAVDRERTGERRLQLLVIDVVEIDRFDSWTGAIAAHRYSIVSRGPGEHR